MRDLPKVHFRTSRNLTRCWKILSAEWKSVRRGFSALAVHDFRVATRRMISELEVAAAVAQDTKTRTLMRTFKKSLKRFGPLRDTQVHLHRTERENPELESEFARFLKRQEQKEIRKLGKRLKEKTRKALRRRVRNTSQDLQITPAKISESVLRSAIENTLRKRFAALMAALSSFRLSSSPEDFHRMRVKLKRFRYASEVAKPLLGMPTKKQLDGMQKLQTIMGDIHDLQTCIAAFEQWSGKSAPSELQKEYDALMKSFNARQGKFEEFNFGSRIMETGRGGHRPLP